MNLHRWKNQSILESLDIHTNYQSNLTKLGALEEFLKAAASAVYPGPAIIWLREHSLLNIYHALTLGSVLM